MFSGLLVFEQFGLLPIIIGNALYAGAQPSFSPVALALLNWMDVMCSHQGNGDVLDVGDGRLNDCVRFGQAVCGYEVSLITQGADCISCCPNRRLGVSVGVAPAPDHRCERGRRELARRAGALYGHGLAELRSWNEQRGTAV